MNKIVTLLATIAFCALSTAMNAALPPVPQWEEQIKNNALEAYWLCVQKGLTAKRFTSEPTQLIQKYIIPTKSVKIVNLDANDLKILIRNAQTDEVLDYAYIYSKHHALYAEIGGRAIVENSDRAIVNIPFTPVKITAKIIKNPKEVVPEVERCFHIQPGELDRIHQILIDEHAVDFCETDKMAMWRIIMFHN